MHFHFTIELYDKIFFYVSELQGTLADYNLLVDLMNTDTEKLEIDEECQELKMLNEVRCFVGKRYTAGWTLVTCISSYLSSELVCLLYRQQY